MTNDLRDYVLSKRFPSSITKIISNVNVTRLVYKEDPKKISKLLNPEHFSIMLKIKSANSLHERGHS